MDKNEKIYIAGHRGLVGSAILQNLENKQYSNLLTRGHTELDLIEPDATADFFANENPEYIFLAAAKVGGIYANNTYPAEFIRDNILIQTNIIHAAYKNNVKRLLFLGSSCIYPKLSPQPIKEEYLLTGPLEPTNRPYALAKIAGIEMCWSYNRQYGTRYLAAMPTNLYGAADNFDLNNSHVIPALIRKFHDAKINKQSTVVVWGTGTPKREFMHSKDLAEACIFLMNLPDEQFDPLLGQGRNDGLPPLINIGVGKDLTIRELAEKIREIVQYPGRIVFDSSKPDGTPRKLMDVTRLDALGFRPKIDLEEGLIETYAGFCAARADISGSSAAELIGVSVK
jgi:GDP-L-fucose synthase